MLPRWLSLPVEQQALTEREAELLMWLWQRKPASLRADEMELIIKLERWNLLAMLPVAEMTAH
jgi:hypothetical protein